MAELIAHHISSISRAGNVGQTNYSAAMAGVAAMTVTWAKGARYKIRVAGIAPGFSDTRTVASIPPKVKDRIVSAIPLRAALSILQDDYYTGAGSSRSMVGCGCDLPAAMIGS